MQVLRLAIESHCWARDRRNKFGGFVQDDRLGACRSEFVSAVFLMFLARLPLPFLCHPKRSALGPRRADRHRWGRRSEGPALSPIANVFLATGHQGPVAVNSLVRKWNRTWGLCSVSREVVENGFCCRGGHTATTSVRKATSVLSATAYQPPPSRQTTPPPREAPHRRQPPEKYRTALQTNPVPQPTAPVVPS